MSNKPKLRFKEFNDEWSSSVFSKTFKTLQNNCFSRDLLNETDDNSIKNVHYGDILIKYGTILDCNNVTLPSIDSTVDLKKFNDESYLKDGDILIADTAEDYTVGKLCEIINVRDKVLSGLHTIPCRPLQDFASRYLGYYMNAYCYHDSLIPLVTGIKVSSISKSSIAKTIIKYPCIDEQKKIADFLNKVDEIIAEREEEVKDLEQQKKGLMQKIFSQQLRFTDSNNNPYPEWEELNIEEVCDITTGKGNTQDKEDDGIYPFYVRSPIIERSNKYIYEGEAVLTVGDGVGTGKVFHYVNGKFNFHQRVYKMSEFKQVIGKYFYYYFSHNFYNRVRKMTAKTSVDSVRLEMIAKMPIQVPCLAEQNKIANLLSHLDELIEEKKALLSDWQSFKKGLLQQMFV